MKGFISIPLLLIISVVSIIGGVVGYSLSPKPEANLGTGQNLNFTGSLSPTRDDFWSLGTTSLRYKGVFSDLTVTTCTGCSSASTADLQDGYNASGADAQITTTNAKDFVLLLQDTATDPHFQILSSPESQSQLQIGTADGSATTTNAIWENYGRLGIGTSTPGVALAVNASTTILGGDVYIFGQLTLPYLVATSTTASSTLPQFSATSITATGLTIQGTLEVEQTGTSTFAGGLSVVGLASSQGLTLTGGHILSSGRLEITANATSTFAGPLTASTSIAVTGRVVATPRADCLTTGVLEFAKGNAGCMSWTGDTTISSDGRQIPNQVFRAWIFHDHTTNLNSDAAFASNTFAFLEGTPTTTSAIAGMFDICTFTPGPTSTLPIAVSCVGPFDW